jgi:hypothetical protein
MPTNVSNECLRLLKGLLVVDPSKRMTYEEFLDSSFIRPGASLSSPEPSRTSSSLSSSKIVEESLIREFSQRASVEVRIPFHFLVFQFFGPNFLRTSQRGKWKNVLFGLFVVCWSKQDESEIVPPAPRQVKVPKVTIIN